LSIRRNTLWNIIGSGLPLVAAILCIPYLIKNLGNESFGILTLIWALIGYFSLFDLGVGRALTYKISQYANSSIKSKAYIFIAGMLITLMAGFVGALIIYLSAQFLVRLINISDVYRIDAIHAFQICALGIIPTTLTSGLRGTLEGLDKFDISNLSKVMIGISMFVLPALAVLFEQNEISAITSYMVLLRVLVCILLLMSLRDFFLRLPIKTLKKYIKSLMDYSVWVWISGIIGPLMVYGDRFFVSAYIGAASLPIYAIPQEGLQRLLILPTAICGALLPKMASLRQSELFSTYDFYFKKVSRYMLSICLLSAILIYPILSIWISPTFAQDSIYIALILCAGIFVNSMSLVPSTLIQARGDTKFIALSHLLELIIYIFLVWWLAKHYGLIGAALAWLLRQIIDLIILRAAVKVLLRNIPKVN
jgi:O-antigen/teichoic acid export membrane protein